MNWLVTLVLAAAGAGSASSIPFAVCLGAPGGLQSQNFAHRDAGLFLVVAPGERDQSAALDDFLGALVQGQCKADDLILQRGAEQSDPRALFIGLRRARNENSGRDVFKPWNSHLAGVPKSGPLSEHRRFAGALGAGVHFGEFLQYPSADLGRVVIEGELGHFARRGIGHGLQSLLDDALQGGHGVAKFYFHFTLPLTTDLFESTRQSFPGVCQKATPSIRRCPEYALELTGKQYTHMAIGTRYFSASAVNEVHQKCT